MKLLRFHYIKGPADHPLDGFHEPFHYKGRDDYQTSPICLAGVNGSGKSKLLELIVEVFYYLDNQFNPLISKPSSTSMQFEIEYLLEGKLSEHVKISQLKDKGIPIVEVFKSGSWIGQHDNIERFLPKQIVGYASGENNTLHRRFLETYYEYGQKVTEFQKKPDIVYKDNKVPDTRLVFLDYDVNSLVFISNFIFRNESDLKIIKGEIKSLIGLESFRLIIQLLPRHDGRKKPIRLTDELKGYIDLLKKCATCWYYEKDTEKTILDFYINKSTCDLFRDHFDSSYDLYTSLYKLVLLNDILIKNEIKEVIRNTEYSNQVLDLPRISSESKVFHIENIRTNVKGAENDIDYHDLSDGEHQFLHVFGSFRMIDEPDILFLMDEPETHFNPEWRSRFITILSKFEHTKKQDFLFTTHSPFILGDCRSDQILIFENKKVRKPRIQTFGLSMERLIKESFGVIPPMSEKALNEIKILRKSSNIEEIEKKLDSFGESIEKIFLYDRIQELKEQHKDEAKKIKVKSKALVKRKRRSGSKTPLKLSGKGKGENPADKIKSRSKDKQKR